MLPRYLHVSPLARGQEPKCQAVGGQALRNVRLRVGGSFLPFVKRLEWSCDEISQGIHGASVKMKLFRVIRCSNTYSAMTVN